MKATLFLFLTLLLFAVNRAAAQSDLSSRLDKLFTGYIDSGFAGSVLVAKENRVVLKKGYGYSNNQRKSLNTPATLFNVASVGKQFTTYAVLLSEKKGLLHINDYLSKYIGRFNDLRDSITIHQLLCHTSGLIKAGTDLDYNTRDGFIQSIKGGESDSRPGEKHRYTNAGFSMLAAVVEIASGIPFEDFVRENIFIPLKMDNTGFPWEKRINKDLLATGYNNNHEPMPVQANIWAARGPGNLVTSVEDLYKWISAYQNKNFMPEEFTNKFFYDYVPGQDTYSWNKSKTAHNTRFYHKGGGRPDFETRIMWYPDDKILVIFCINNDYNLARKLFTQVTDIIN